MCSSSKDSKLTLVLFTALTPQHHIVPVVACLWHTRLGQPNNAILNKVLTQVHVALVSISSSSQSFYEACQYRKLHQNSFPSTTQKTTQPFQLVHSDVWGPSPHLSVDGYIYRISFVDDFTHFVWIFPLCQKFESTSIF